MTIPLLVEYLIDRYAQAAGKKFRNIDKGTLKLFPDLRLARQRSRVAE